MWIQDREANEQTYIISCYFVFGGLLMPGHQNRGCSSSRLDSRQNVLNKRAKHRSQERESHARAAQAPDRGPRPGGTPHPLFNCLGFRVCITKYPTPIPGKGRNLSLPLNSLLLPGLQFNLLQSHPRPEASTLQVDAIGPKTYTRSVSLSLYIYNVYTHTYKHTYAAASA